MEGNESEIEDLRCPSCGSDTFKRYLLDIIKYAAGAIEELKVDQEALWCDKCSKRVR